ncbi:hypothetical protein OSB04_014505 [Centaurea solstitialis]|uniref:Uncharacterized protein n=1 Tax=Centaurea solstitialis TaxID=347529 RepID=A0AA38WFM6_9ASTR|nr:hypothetical protein OSB04_014505 [Centaurea solstitialis]
MKSLLSACKQVTIPSMSFPGRINMDSFLPRNRKDKVVIVIGATGTGKSRLAIDLATKFPAEIVNSDKMQVYKGLDIATNKVTHDECRGIPHHLLGFLDPNLDFTANDFGHHASMVVESIVSKDRLPIVAGGSNSYVKALVHDNIEFKSRYACCVLWVHVSLPVLHSFVSKRVDRMVRAGLVDEVRRLYDPNLTDRNVGIRRAIGVPELDRFFANENPETLKEAISTVKTNTCKLASRQLKNIISLQTQMKMDLHHLDATEVFLKNGLEADEAWERLVAGPSGLIVGDFLYEEERELKKTIMKTVAPPPMTTAIAAVARW